MKNIFTKLLSIKDIWALRTLILLGMVVIGWVMWNAVNTHSNLFIVISLGMVILAFAYLLFMTIKVTEKEKQSTIGDMFYDTKNHSESGKE